MASSLIRKIEANFLACAICFEPLHDPIGLPCLHGYCFECLDNWYNTSQDKTQVICPACKVAATVPAGGIRGFPGHFLQETIDMEIQVKQKPQQNPQRTELKVGDPVCVLKSTTGTYYNTWGGYYYEPQIPYSGVGNITVINGTSCTVEYTEYKHWKGNIDEIELVERCNCCSKRAVVYCLDCEDNLCEGCWDSHKASRFVKDHTIATIDDIQSGKVTLEEGHL